VTQWAAAAGEAVAVRLIALGFIGIALACLPFMLLAATWDRRRRS
jgi:uncharacterized membrane protein YbaN (DUF454 family)